MAEATNTPPLKFSEVYQEEQAEIRTRRERQFYVADKNRTSWPDCVGLALSGGGIRSATFCLGFLQELKRLKLLRIFDYLSTVSGGGYVGGWWSAWLSRDEKIARRSGDPLLEVSNVHNAASLVARIADGDDEVSRDLREQIRLQDNLTYRLLTKYAEGELPDYKLLNKLVDQLNAFIKTDDYPEAEADAALLASVPNRAAEAELTTAEKGELEKARSRQKDAWWEKRFLLEEAFPYELRNNFPPHEIIEPVRRTNEDKGENAEGSLHAYRDPIHHLRLFANYLTPRKGMLSADTWRAVSVITRNLILTWLILLPVLITVMLVGQAYLRLGVPVVRLFSVGAYTNHVLILAPIVVLVSWSVVVAIGWLICNRESTSRFDGLVQLACLLALLLLLGSGMLSIERVKIFIGLLGGRFWFSLGIWAVMTSLLVIWLWFGGSNKEKIGIDEPQWKRDVRRSRFSRAQARLLVTTAVVSVVLGVSWICTTKVIKTIQNPFNIKFGLVSLISVAGSIFTAWRAKPTAGGDRAASREPTFISRLIFAVTPPLVLMVLVTLAGFVAYWVLARFLEKPLGQGPSLISTAALLFIIICGALAAYELKDIKSFRILEPSFSAALFIGAVVINASWFVQALLYSRLLPVDIYKGWGLLLFVGSMAIAVVITVYILAHIIPGQLWKGKLVERIQNAGQEIEGAYGERTRAAVRRVQDYVNLTFGLVILTVLAVAGWSVGNFLFKMIGVSTVNAVAVSNGNKGGVFNALILGLVSITGGVIMYRLCLVRRPSPIGERAMGKDGSIYPPEAPPDRHFDLRWWKHRSFANRPEAHWVLAALCLIVPVGFVCLSHNLALAPQGDHTLRMILFPFALAALLGVLIFLRSLVIEKSVADEASPGTWLKRFFRRVFPSAEKHEQHVLRLLAFTTILLSILADPVSLTISGSYMTPVGPLGSRANLILMGVMLVIGLPIFGAAIFQLRPSPTLNVGRTFKRWNWVYSTAFLWTLAFAAIVLALTAGFLLRHWAISVSHIPLDRDLTPVLLPGAAGCLLFVLFEMFWTKGENRRSLWLVALTYVGFATIFFLGLASKLDPETVHAWQVFLGLLSAVVVWVVALGWMVDPNAVSMHQFYKGRLVRAYLGASNLRRRRHGKKEITETVAGDDILLKSLHNCERGGPYHLINTTLNLVGGRDLATAQRSASSFTLSQKHCGSSRTDYRPTDRYMSGQLSLGTAVAASGAAVSPNMGSKKPTAALAMLMTLLNVRLGYWAPTPNRETWSSSQPRLWPFYLLREFLSQTNDVANYCYLTDGGHFDNTGLYSLIERGCRYIVLVDCAADPKPACFQDLGEAIRRCRIDFGTEIDLSLDSLLGKKADHCFVFGSIRFSKDHLLALGRYQPDNEGGAADISLGTIIYVKPAVVSSVTADVQQYALENKYFPQQTTANQWFDEAQFESYRRLGQFCASKVFNTEAVQELGKVIRLSTPDIETLFTELENASKK